MRYAILALSVILPLAQGCAPVLIGGAVATGVIAAEDRRTVGTMTDDQRIEIQASNRIGESLKGNVHVNVTSFNRVVLLSGEVPDAASKERAGQVVKTVDGVRNVYNELVVMGVTPLSSRTNDTLITSKVKGRFVDVSKFSPVHVKVVTENGVVYLMGLVTRQEATDATEVARTTSGVLKVVRLFEYIEEPAKK